MENTWTSDIDDRIERHLQNNTIDAAMDLISDKAKQVVELPNDTGRKRRATSPRSDINGPTTRIPVSRKRAVHQSVVRTRLCWVRRCKVQMEHDPCQQLIHRYEMSVNELSNRCQELRELLVGTETGARELLAQDLAIIDAVIARQESLERRDACPGR